MNTTSFIFRWLGLSLAMMLLWIASNLIAETLLGYRLPGTDTPAEVALGLFFTVCLLHTLMVILLIRQASASARQTWITLVLLLWGVQYIMPQSETLWFNAAVSMPLKAVAVLLLSGLLLAGTFSALATKFIPGKGNKHSRPSIGNSRTFWVRWAVLCVFVYPFLYFTAGYFIAWQSEEVRLFYTGSTHLASFFSMMVENILSGLYLFQVARAVVWVALAWLVLRVLECSIGQQALLVGLLFAVLMNAQLLVPNPYMPASVRWVHLVETALSNFVWGFLIAYFLRPAMNSKKASRAQSRDYEQLPPEVKAT